MSCPPRIPNEYASNSGFDPLYGVCVCVCICLFVIVLIYLFILLKAGVEDGWVCCKMRFLRHQERFLMWRFLTGWCI